MKPPSELEILVWDTIITENERLKLHKENTLQDKWLCNTIENLRLRKYRNSECSACSAVGDIIVIIRWKNIFVSVQSLPASFTSQRGRLDCVMSQPHTLTYCMETNFKIWSNRSQLQMPTRANATLNHIIPANFAIISVMSNPMLKIPRWEPPYEDQTSLECIKGS